MELTAAEEYIYTEELSSYWGCNAEVCELNFIIATMIMTTSIAAADT